MEKDSTFLTKLYKLNEQKEGKTKTTLRAIFTSFALKKHWRTFISCRFSRISHPCRPCLEYVLKKRFGLSLGNQHAKPFWEASINNCGDILYEQTTKFPTAIALPSIILKKHFLKKNKHKFTICFEMSCTIRNWVYFFSRYITHNSIFHTAFYTWHIQYMQCLI